jgi:hypothetical protein
MCPTRTAQTLVSESTSRAGEWLVKDDNSSHFLLDRRVVFMCMYMYVYVYVYMG